MQRHPGFGALLIALFACASGPPLVPKGELLVVVETTTAIGYVEFVRPESGDAARAVAIPEGTSEQTIRVRPGTWCLFEISLGSGAVGHGLRSHGEHCVEVRTEDTTRFGRIRVDGQNIDFFELPRAPPRA
jgi:hypothetical protein